MPVDPDFRKKRKKIGKEKAVAIWGPVNPPERLGIRGTYVAVDWDICNGCGKCLEICPEKLYEWKETFGHSTSKKKAFPAREVKCIQCLLCEEQCPLQAIRITYGGPPSLLGWFGWMVLLTFFTQIIVGVAYGTLFGPYLGLEILFYLGWIVLILGFPFLFSFAILPKKGKPQESKEDSLLTTVVVDSGFYSIVRHPGYLGSMMLMSSSVLISQHPLSVVICVLVLAWFYRDIPKEEKGLSIRLGDDYKRYMERVPRLNILLGLIRILQRRRHTK